MKVDGRPSFPGRRPEDSLAQPWRIPAYRSVCELAATGLGRRPGCAELPLFLGIGARYLVPFSYAPLLYIVPPVLPSQPPLSGSLNRSELRLFFGGRPEGGRILLPNEAG